MMLTVSGRKVVVDTDQTAHRSWRKRMGTCANVAMWRYEEVDAFKTL